MQVMITRTLFWMIACLCCLISCSGSSSQELVDSENPATELQASADKLMTSSSASRSFDVISQTALKEANLRDIFTVHCDAYDNDNTNATAAFGCFMAKAAMMFQSDEIDAIVTAFGEPTIDIQSNILNKNNSEALCTGLASMGSKQYFNAFPKLPFNAKVFKTKLFKQLLMLIRNKEISVSQVQDNLFALDNDLDELMAILAIPQKAKGFSFVIPKELCQVSKDVEIKNIDLEGFYALTASFKVLINILHTYTIGLDPQYIINTDGGIEKIPFVRDANGVGGDKKKFAEVAKGQGDLSALRPLILSAINSLAIVIDGINQESDSDVFGKLIVSHAGFFDSMKHYALDMQASINNPSAMTPLIHANHPDVKVNVMHCLSNMPNPALVTGVDPFVIDKSAYSSTHIKAVESFFDKLFDSCLMY